MYCEFLWKLYVGDNVYWKFKVIYEGWNVVAKFHPWNSSSYFTHLSKYNLKYEKQRRLNYLWFASVSQLTYKSPVALFHTFKLCVEYIYIYLPSYFELCSNCRTLCNSYIYWIKSYIRSAYEYKGPPLFLTRLSHFHLLTSV